MINWKEKTITMWLEKMMSDKDILDVIEDFEAIKKRSHE